MATVEEKNHDSSTTLGDHYDSVSNGDGGLSIIAGAALDGSTYGVQCDWDAGGSTRRLRDALTFSSDDLALRMLIDFGNTTNGGAGVEFLNTVALRDTGTGNLIFEIVFQFDDATNLSSRASYYSDGGASNVYTSWYSIPSSGEICLEIRTVKETADTNADGTLDFYIDSVLQESITDADNFNNFNNIDQIHNNFTHVGNAAGTMKFDQWILDDSSAASLGCSSVINAFRFLGFAADTGTLMISGLKDDATLKLYDYDLATLTEGGTASFGSAADADLDNRTLGIFPVSRPASDDVWYLYGNDGNDLQVQYNDRNGTLGWVDLGPGTATWDTAKYAMALMPEPTSPDDVIVAFSDNDVYRTRFGTVTWVKMGDAGGTLRAAARQITNRFNEALFAGTAAGTLEYTNNFGVTFGDVSGTALGVINALAVSL